MTSPHHQSRHKASVLAATVFAAALLAGPSCSDTEDNLAGFTEEQVDAFVNAGIDIAIINTAAREEFLKTADKEQQNAIVAAARAEMDTVITNAPGIDMDLYVAISEAAEANPAFAEELSTRAKEQFRLLDEAHENLGEDEGEDTEN